MAKKMSQYDIYKRDYNKAMGKKNGGGSRAIRIILLLLVLGVIGVAAFQIIRNPDTADTAAQTVTNISDRVTDALTPDPIQLTPGDWTAGTDFPEGRYLITTDDEYCMISGNHWLNTLHRGDDGYTTTFDKGDTLSCTDHVTITPVK